LSIELHWRQCCAAVALLAATPIHAADTPPPLSAYGALPAVEQMTLSPDGHNLATVALADGIRRLIVIDADGKARIQYPLAAAKIRSLRWADATHVAIWMSRTTELGADFVKSTMELWSAVIVPLDGSKAWTVFGDNAAMDPAVFGHYGFRTVNGHPIGYFAGLELTPEPGSAVPHYVHAEPSLFAVDLATRTQRRIAPPADRGYSRDWLVDADGNLAATLELDHALGNWTLSAANGTILAHGRDPSGSIELHAMGKDGTAIIISKRDEVGGNIHWYRVPAGGGELMPFMAALTIDAIAVDSATGRMDGYVPRSADGSSIPVLLDPASQARIRQIVNAFPDVRVQVRAYTADAGHVLVRTSGNADPGTWYLVDAQAGKAAIVGNERPMIANAQVGAIRTIPYKASDGLDMSGILTLPPGRAANHLPVVMLPHGGPHEHDIAQFDWWAQALASRGYAVFQPNFRGSTDRDEAFRDAGNGEWGRRIQTDISDGLAELARQGIVDPRRACIVGAGYGGYAALAGVTLQHGLYRCAVAVAAISDIAEMATTNVAETGGDPMVKRQLDRLLGDPAHFDEVSPRRHAAQADAPILLIHGKDDTVVPFRQSDRMASALRAAHKPVDMVVMEKEDHWLSRSETRQQMLEACVGFVLKHNPPD